MSALHPMVAEIDRLREIDAMFEGAAGWGSWMVMAANEREGIVNRLHALGHTEIEHKYLARTSDGGRTD